MGVCNKNGKILKDLLNLGVQIMPYKKNICLSISLCFIVSGCANIVPNYRYNTTKKKELIQGDTPTKVINSFKENTEEKLLTQAIEQEAISKRDESFLMPVRNSKVKFWIKYFSTRNKDGLQRFVKNGEEYKPIIESIFEKYGLPKELYYVGLIESGYQNRARSHAGAVGPWQFIKGTATRYGLKVTRSIDERKNIYKSTEAAALYFQDLYNIFGSWELALAAYNAGEYGIIRRIRGANTREYYELSRRKIIPKETRNYVPKVLAVMEILSNPKKYDIKIIKPSHNIFVNTKSIHIKSSIGLNTLAKKLNVSKSIIKALNHDISGNHIRHLGKGGFEIFLPDSSTKNLSRINDYLKSRPQKRVSKSKQPKENKQIHIVRKNESLYSISRRYNLKTNILRRLNKIKSNTIYIGQKLELPTNSNTKILYSYTVKTGDNLSLIARTFKTDIKNIKSMNRIKRSKIFVGQKLKVPAHKAKYYTVSRGDVLGQIAKRENQSVNELRRLNKIRSHIFPGQILIVKIKLL
ncbi:MAG: membrane-bound lytic murein transglycosylase D [Bacteriovoracaceae bacterium]|jgi:membrane-bound lytic murein transglycosylase D